MRLEVFCEDRLGLTRELLDLLVLRGTFYGIWSTLLPVPEILSCLLAQAD